MKVINRIRWFGTAGDSVRRYGVSAKITTEYDDNDTYSYGKPIDLQMITQRAQVALTAFMATNAILAIPGITKVTVTKYELAVSLASAFNWADCHHKILRTIKTHIFPRKRKIKITKGRS